MKKITKSQYKELTKKIIEAVPEIVELRLGCKVSTAQYAHLDPMILIDRDRAIKGDWKVFSKGGSSFYQNEKDFKIIGRDICLADVLIALEDKYKNSICVLPSGEFFIKYPPMAKRMNITQYTEIFWDLQRNSLEWHYENKPETCLFLYTLQTYINENNR